jgi:hypothetical protein
MKDEALKLALSCIKSSVEYKRGNATFIEAAEDVEQALAASVQDIFDHQQAASAALRESMNRSVVIAKNTVPTLQKRPPNCGTGYCSCVECVMEPTPVQADAWPCVIAEADFEQNTVTLEMQCSDYKVVAGQHWLHTTPPAAQRQWVGLSHKEVMDSWDEIRDGDWAPDFYAVIEAKLKEKNT